MTHRILFVCLGNICRSPTAEAVTRAKAAARGMDLVLDSAGTGNWHVGKPPYALMQEAARARGYDLSPLRARQVLPTDLSDFDRVIVMDADNAADLASFGSTDRVTLFTEYAPSSGATYVPDPYFTRDFEGALALIEDCAEGLLDALEQQAQSNRSDN
jgi:protein-tyrosine phosphatase